MRSISSCLLAALIAILGFLGPITANAVNLPPLPTAIKKQGMIRVGTKCDYPPAGFLNNSGTPVGIEVAMAHQIAEYAFGDGSKAKIVCVTSSNRVPDLLGGKVDLVIATMGITKKRAQVVDFSEPYEWGASSVLVRRDSHIRSMKDLKGRTVVFVKGAWQIPWFKKHMPDAHRLLLNSVSDALQALMQGRAAGFAEDLEVEASLAKQNNHLRLLPERYKLGDRGAAVRPGEKQWLAYVNAAIKKMKEQGKITQWIHKYAKPENVKMRLKMWDMAQMPKQ